MQKIINKKGKVVISLFDGMSGMQIALKDMGILVDAYYASEIDKHAIAQTQLNFPHTKQLGSVVKFKLYFCTSQKNRDMMYNYYYTSDATKRIIEFCNEIYQIGVDIIAAGSPCQGFSFAGKQLAFDDPRSKLFFVFVDILNHIKKQINPNVLFLLENVKMKKEHEAVITQYTGVNPVEINSALLSAQNRVRLYWTNIGVIRQGLFDEVYPGIKQPKDKGILLRDILESDVPEKYYLSEKSLATIQKHGAINHIDNDKYNCLLTGYHKMGGRDQQYVKDFQGLDINKKARTLRTGGSQSQDDKHNYDLIKIDKNGIPKANQDKASCFTAGGNSGGNHSDMDLIMVQGAIKFGRSDEAKELRKESMKKGKDHTPFQAKEIVGIDYEKMGALLTGTNKDNLVLQINPSKESAGKQPYQQNRVYDSNGISPALCANKADLLVFHAGIKNGELVEGNSRDFSQGNRIYETSGKSVTLSAQGGGMGGKTGLYVVKSDFISLEEVRRKFIKSLIDTFANPNLKNNTIIDFSHQNEGLRYYNDKSPTLNQRDYKEPRCVYKNYRIRRLTPLECARLQTIPEWYKFSFIESYYFGYICSVTKKTIICQSNVVSIIATENYQIRTQDFVTCTTLDLLEMEQLRLDLKYKKINNAKLKDAIEQHKQCNMETYVLCTIKDFIDINLGTTQLNKVCKNVNIVIEKLEEVEDLECAQIIIEATNSMEIHLKLKTEEKKQKTDLTLMDILDVKIKKKDTSLSWRIKLGENLKEEKLSITLTLLNWIIENQIYTYVKDSLNIHLSTGNWNVSEQNCIIVELSDLRMESIISSSDTQKYRQLGNGWTNEVIKHILSYANF